MIACGSSDARVVGRDDRRRRRARAATSPISGRLARSRSPPQPNTHDQRAPSRDAARRASTVVERVGRVGVVDEHGERLAGLDRLERPGTPATDAMPGGDRVERHVRSGARATRRASTFATLKRAAQPRLATASAPARRDELGTAIRPSSSCSSSRPARRRVVDAVADGSPASRRPYASSTFDRAVGQRPSNSRALAAKYSSIVPWKSRWSCDRLVNAAAANRTPSTRCRSSACDDTSIAHAPVAGVEHAREQCAAGRSPRASSARPARRAPPTPARSCRAGRTGRRPPSRIARDHVGRRGLAVRAGHARHAQRAASARRRTGRRAAPSRARASATIDLRHRRRRAPARTTSATAPRRDGRSGVVVAVRRSPRARRRTARRARRDASRRRGRRSRRRPARAEPRARRGRRAGGRAAPAECRIVGFTAGSVRRPRLKRAGRRDNLVRDKTVEVTHGTDRGRYGWQLRAATRPSVSRLPRPLPQERVLEIVHVWPEPDDRQPGPHRRPAVREPRSPARASAEQLAQATPPRSRPSVAPDITVDPVADGRRHGAGAVRRVGRRRPAGDRLARPRRPEVAGASDPSRTTACHTRPLPRRRRAPRVHGRRPRGRRRRRQRRERRPPSSTPRRPRRAAARSCTSSTRGTSRRPSRSARWPSPRRRSSTRRP